MSLAHRNDSLFSRIRSYHDELWAEHDRMIKRHHELMDKMWREIDQDFFAEHQRIRDSFESFHERVHKSSCTSSSSSSSSTAAAAAATTAAASSSSTSNTHQQQQQQQSSATSKQEVAVKKNELDVFPRVANNQVSMKLQIPEKVDQSKLTVNNQEGDLVVRLEDKQETNGCHRSVCYFSRVSMPANTDFSKLNWSLDERNILTVSAPLKTE